MMSYGDGLSFLNPRSEGSGKDTEIERKKDGEAVLYLSAEYCADLDSETVEKR